MTETTFQRDVEELIEETLVVLRATDYNNPRGVITEETGYIVDNLRVRGLLRVIEQNDGGLDTVDAVGEDIETVLKNAAFRTLEREITQRMQEDD